MQKSNTYFNDLKHPDTKPSLGQISSLVKILKDDKNIFKHFILDDAFDKLEIGFKSAKQLSYFNYLLFEKKYSKVNLMLTQFGINQKNVPNKYHIK